MNDNKTINTDILVIGSGVAGLRFALKAADYGRVLIVTKSSTSKSATRLAQGGIASVLSEDDSIECHISDTLNTGYGLNKPEIVRKIVEHGPDAIRELIDLGVPLDTVPGEDDKLSLTREGGHSARRILHVADATGYAIEKGYIEATKTISNIRLLQNSCAIDLLTQHHLPDDHPRQKDPLTCWGAYVFDEETGHVNTIRAKITLLATGGGGHVYKHTTNPSVATGDGVAMAYRAGATVSNMEFFQFHPTMFYDPGGDNFLITEAARGEGGILRNSNGERFMEAIHPNMELAPRDVVSRAIDEQLKTRGDTNVFLDLTHKGAEFIKGRFPNIYKHCLDRGIDITKEWIPVVPAAHYMCGGVKVDEHGRTDIGNLLAAGEVACTGMHGANRLASNSLLESMAYAQFAFETLKNTISNIESIPELPSWNDSGVFDRREWVIVRHIREELQSVMWDYVGIVRSDDRLEAAKRFVNFLFSQINEFYKQNPVRQDVIELRNLSMLAWLIILSTQCRPESRGLHFNIDHPQKSDKYSNDTELRSSRFHREEHLTEGLIGLA